MAEVNCFINVDEMGERWTSKMSIYFYVSSTMEGKNKLFLHAALVCPLNAFVFRNHNIEKQRRCMIKT